MGTTTSPQSVSINGERSLTSSVSVSALCHLGYMNVCLRLTDGLIYTHEGTLLRWAGEQPRDAPNKSDIFCDHCHISRREGYTASAPTVHQETDRQLSSRKSNLSSHRSPHSAATIDPQCPEHQPSSLQHCRCRCSDRLPP